MLEKRHFHRFTLQLEAKLSVRDQNGAFQFHTVKTDNISAGGVFVQSSSKYPIGTSLFMKIYLPVPSSSSKDPQHSILRGLGSVVRNSPTGFAVCFENECTIMPVPEA